MTLWPMNIKQQEEAVAVLVLLEGGEAYYQHAIKRYNLYTEHDTR